MLEITAKQERELHKIRLALTKAEGERDLAKREFSEKLKKLELENEIFKAKNTKFGTDQENANSVARYAKSIEISSKFDGLCKTSSRQLIEHLTSSYKTDISTDQSELSSTANENSINSQILETCEHLKAEVHTLKLNLDDAKQFSYDIEHKLANEQCNTKILKKIIDLTKIRENSSNTSENVSAAELTKQIPDWRSRNQNFTETCTTEILRLNKLLTDPVERVKINRDHGNDVFVTNQALEFAVLTEELMSLKLQLTKLKKNKTLADEKTDENGNRVPSFEELKTLPVVKQEDVLMRNKVVELEEALDREEKLKSMVSSLKGTLQRLQATSKEQQVHSARFIGDLKRQNDSLKRQVKRLADNGNGSAMYTSKSSICRGYASDVQNFV